MGKTTWTAFGSPSTVLSTQLNSLADGAESALGVAIDNTSALELYADFEVNLASLNPTGSPYVVLKLYAEVDGTNTEDSPSVNPPAYTASVTTGTGAKRAVIRGVPLGPGKYTATLTNETNVAFNASGNTVVARSYSTTTAA